MDTMGCVQAPPIRKGKKKQAKDEVDRLKQAEKKKRRLEKALATSAAIRSELEKKKQKKKEEQQRLDEEGAAIAEAVAMHVLLGEDSDDSCKFVMQNDEAFNPWSCANNIGLLMGGLKTGSSSQSYTMYSLEGLGRVSEAYGMGCKFNDWGIGSLTFSNDFGREPNPPYSEERIHGSTEVSAGLIAAQAVSSLQIAEEDAHTDSILINRMLRSIKKSLCKWFEWGQFGNSYKTCVWSLDVVTLQCSPFVVSSCSTKQLDGATAWDGGGTRATTSDCLGGGAQVTTYVVWWKPRSAQEVRWDQTETQPYLNQNQSDPIPTLPNPYTTQPMIRHEVLIWPSVCSKICFTLECR